MSGKYYLILGIVFLAIGITMLMTGAVSRTMAYGDLVLAAVFFGYSVRENKKSGGKKDEKKPDDDSKDE
ncbi:MAG: hypothetical protein IJJ06_03415 [Mogibacterium sp.]|nr:hypothetical protein [Mogibacterium sp.]